MTDENADTADLTMDEKLDLILKRLDGVENRLGALEAQSAGNTRPLLDQIIKEMTGTRDMLTERMDEIKARLDGVEKEMARTRDALNERMIAVEKELRSMNHQLEAVAVNWMKTQGTIREHAERLTELESRPN